MEIFVYDDAGDSNELACVDVECIPAAGDIMRINEDNYVVVRREWVIGNRSADDVYVDVMVIAEPLPPE